MDKQNKRWYLVFIASLPLFFILHGINQHFGLIPPRDLAWLLLYYFAVTAGVTSLSWFLFRRSDKAALITFLLLFVFFFFGVFKDLAKRYAWLEDITSYRILIPTLPVTIAVIIYLTRKTRRTFYTTVTLLGIILLVNLGLEAGMLMYNFFTHQAEKQEFGDRTHELIASAPLHNIEKKPHIFWIISDEYSSSAVLRRYWNYDNPLDSALQQRGFFVADSAESSYNYTQYSLLSSLDMLYVDEFEKRRVITYRDIIRSHRSLYRTNATELLEQYGYGIVNYSVADMKNAPASSFSRFHLDPDMLIHNETLPGRVTLDIGWNFPYLFMEAKKRDSIIAREAYTGIDRINDSLLAGVMRTLQEQSPATDPRLFMLHLMFSHDPFLYNPDGSLNIQDKLGIRPERYIPAIEYTNHVLLNVIDSIRSWYADKDFVIVLQGDHGFKFREDEAMYEKDMCKIFYAVYSSDGRYAGWNHAVNGVNTFRILFNNYFQSSFPYLPGRSFPLYYR